jgi:hypothetical protein
LRPSERGEPNFVDGLLSDRSFGGGKAVLKRGLVVYVPLNPAPVEVAMGVFDGVGKMKALVLLTEASRQVMMRREIMIAVDVCSNIYLAERIPYSTAPRFYWFFFTKSPNPLHRN